jgi:hypothetical protein
MSTTDEGAHQDLSAGSFHEYDNMYEVGSANNNKDCPICFYPMDDKDTLKMICCQNSLCKICNELVKDRQSKGLLQNGCIFATTSNFGCSNCK